MRPGTILAGFLALIVAFALLIWINNLGRSSLVEESEPVIVTSEEGVYARNPFEDEIPDPPPGAEIEETTHNFGRMAVGDTQTHTFVVRNVGEGVLKLARGVSTCKCTVGTLGRNEAPPGEVVEIELEWTATAAEPFFSQSATVYTNDPAHPQFSLAVEGLLGDWIQTFPGDTWTGTMSETEETPFEFVVASQLAESFTITGVETSTDLIHLEEEDITPIPAEDLEQYRSALSGYRINGRLGSGFPVGEIHEHLIVSTDIEQVPEIRLYIASQRIGPFLVVGPGWQASLKLLSMGRFDAAEGLTRQLSFFVEEDGNGFQFTDVTVEPPVVDVTWKEDDTFESRTRKRIWVEVIAAPGMPPGRWVREDPIHVTLSTNDPDASEWEFSVLLQAN